MARVTDVLIFKKLKKILLWASNCKLNESIKYIKRGNVSLLEQQTTHRDLKHDKGPQVEDSQRFRITGLKSV